MVQPPQIEIEAESEQQQIISMESSVSSEGVTMKLEGVGKKL